MTVLIKHRQGVSAWLARPEDTAHDAAIIAAPDRVFVYHGLSHTDRLHRDRTQIHL